MRHQTIKQLLCMAAFLLLSSPTYAALYRGVDFPDGAISFADEIISYTQGSGNVASNRADPSAALGIPDGSSEDINYVSLGDEGSLIVRFTDNHLTTSGNSNADLFIFGIGDVEIADIFISTDATQWIYVGATNSNVTGIDIDAFIGAGVVSGTQYNYVRINDLLPADPSSTSSGVDIDAIGALNSITNISVPPTFLLLAFGIGFSLKPNHPKKRHVPPRKKAPAPFKNELLLTS